MAERPLAGRRIVVTRPASTRSPRRARSSGSAPTCRSSRSSRSSRSRTTPRSTPRSSSVATYDWIVFTSANGVAACRRPARGTSAGRARRRGRSRHRATRCATLGRRARIRRPTSSRARGDRGRASGRSRARASCFRKPTSRTPRARGRAPRTRGTRSTRSTRIGRSRSSPRRERRARDLRAPTRSSSRADPPRAASRQSRVVDARPRRVVVCIGPKTAEAAARQGSRWASSPTRRPPRASFRLSRRTSGRAHDRLRRDGSARRASTQGRAPVGRAGCAGRRRSATSSARRRSTPRRLRLPALRRPGRGRARAVESMPGIDQLSSTRSPRKPRSSTRSASRRFCSSGSRATKDALGLESYAEDGVVQQAIAALKDASPELVVITDVCLCEYTDHGHCGAARRGRLPAERRDARAPRPASPSPTRRRARTSSRRAG